MAKTANASAGKRMSDAAVKAKTGKTWPEWFAVLNGAGAERMTHQEIVAYLAQKHGVGPWWQQMVTNTYEKELGRRALHQMPEGYQVSVSKTFAAPVGALFNAWQEGEVRRRWLPEAEFTVTRATPGKSLRIAWLDGTRVEVNLYARGEGKAQMTVQQSKLPTAEAAEQAKAFWREAVGRLGAVVGV
ncbi:MAG: DUF4287 domain-containing protein [Chloroflexi bacterium]|nr:DUF4287 domain-containing protein [Chloroflexota bacterium]